MKNNSPNVAVIINCLNGEEFLEKCFFSVVSQSYRNLEIVFYDNNSQDKSIDIAHKFQEKDRRIKIYKNDRTKTLGIVRSEAIKKTNAELISFIDVDDYWSSNKIQLQVNKFLDNPNIGLVYGRTAIKKNGKFYYKIDRAKNQDIYSRLLKKNFIFFSSVMFSREAYKKCGGFDTQLKNSIDYKLFLDIARNYECDYVDEYVCIYLSHNKSLSNRQRKIAYKESLQILKEHPLSSNLNNRYEIVSLLSEFKIINTLKLILSIKFYYLFKEIYLYIINSYKKRISDSLIKEKFFNKNILFLEGLSDGGGVEKIFSKLESELPLRGYRVDRISILEKNILGYKTNKFPLSYRNIIFLYKFIKYLKKSDQSIIISSIYYTSLISYLANIFAGGHHLVFSLHNGVPYKELNILQKIIFKILALISSKKNISLLSCSKSNSKEHIDHGFSKNITIIENGISASKFKNQGKTNYFFKSSDNNYQPELVLGFFARYHKLKNHKLALEVLKEIINQGIDAKLILAGKFINQANEELMVLVKKYNLSNNVLLLDFRNDINFLLNEIDIYFSPSFAEALPLTLIEAAYLGKYIISSDVGDCKDVVKYNGVVVNSFEKAKYVKAVIDYMNLERETKSEMSKSNIKHLKMRYSARDMIDKYDNFLEEIYRKVL